MCEEWTRKKLDDHQKMYGDKSTSGCFKFVILAVFIVGMIKYCSGKLYKKAY